jgi:preprotein translocase subunit YajC
MFSLISEAHAQTTVTTPPTTGTTTATPAASTTPPGATPPNSLEGMLMQFMPLILIFAVFYFMLIRPQQKRYEQHKTMVEGLRRGDRVVTGGGFIGTVVKVEGDEAVVEIAENVKVTVVKSTITAVNSKTEPDAAAKKE